MACGKHPMTADHYYYYYYFYFYLLSRVQSASCREESTMLKSTSLETFVATPRPSNLYSILATVHRRAYGQKDHNLSIEKLSGCNPQEASKSIQQTLSGEPTMC